MALAFVILAGMSEEDCGGQSPSPQLEDTALTLREVRAGP